MLLQSFSLSVVYMNFDFDWTLPFNVCKHCASRKQQQQE